MRFNYQARTREGEIQTGTVEASSYEAAIDTLQRHNLTVVFLEAVSGIPFYARSLKFLQRVKAKELVVFFRQLAILFEANTPLLDSLRAVADQARNPFFKDVLFEVEADVRGGESLSTALKKHGKIFSSFYIKVIQSGEVTGNLDKILMYLADHAEKELLLRQKVKGAFVYPAFIITVFIIVAILMLVYVVPQLTAVLIESGGELPLITRILVGTSDFLRSWIWLLILIVAVLAISIPRYLKTEAGREQRDRALLKLPVFSGLARKIYIARMSENLSTLLRGGLPILGALKIASQVVGNAVFRNLLEGAMDEVKKGGTISAVFERDKKNIPASVVQMLKVAEKTAKLDSILERLAAFYQTEVDRTVVNLTQLIEPLLIVVLGGAVAFLVASILMPIYNITSGGF